MENTVGNFHDIYQEVECDYNYIPNAIEYIKSLRSFGIALLSFGSALLMLTLYFSVNACYNVLFQKDSRSYKTNAIIILWVYPVASLCSLMTIVIPRAQLLSTAVTQIFLAIALYRLYCLLVYVGRKKITKTPSLMLRVGPCCCWPCLPFPSLEMTDANLSWLRILALQLPIVQAVLHFALLLMASEDLTLAVQYSIYIQPFTLISILLGVYSLTVTMKSLHTVIPEAKLNYKAIVSQLVLLFTKLQALIVKNLSSTGLFPCNPPITPSIYADVTYNTLVLIEMLILCYVARHIYYIDLDKNEESDTIDWPNYRTKQTDLVNISQDSGRFTTITTIT